MKSSLNSAKKSLSGASKKTAVFLVVLLTLFSFLFTPFSPLQAQATDAPAAAQRTITAITLTFWQKLGKLLVKVGSNSFQTASRTALNKIAYDTANYIGSGGSGQKPLFITADWGDYLAQVGDEAAGQFIETFATNLAETSESDSVKSKECQNTYQTCSALCIRNGKLASLNAIAGKTNSGPTESSCMSTCQSAALACDKNVSKSNSGIVSGTKSVNICQPSSLEAKVKIGLGLVEQQRPGSPNCTASEMATNWKDEYKRYEDMANADFLVKYASIFNPTGNDLGIYVAAQEGLNSQQTIVDKTTSLKLTGKGGWLDKVGIDRELIGIPNDAKTKRDSAGNLMDANFAKVTGDIVVDAASVFLNQVAITGFKTLMANLTKKASQNPNLNNPNEDPTVRYGEGSVKEATASIIKPDFGVRADYDILSQLAVCPDPKNPGPTDCVIDDKFAQGIAEKKTVIEAIKEGYINGNYQISKDTIDSTYSLRNISILRKYRILPIGWEEAINVATADQNNIKKVTVMDLVSCFALGDGYDDDFSTGFNRNNQTWCRGLVDPNWVLKAPLNSCRSEGTGAQILNKNVTPSIASLNSNPYAPSILNVARSENYCADEQTCIKEKSDGSCEVYGYCNEEKRTWNFSSDTCQPINNTCQSFVNPTTGKNVSYLENTLNYNGCSPESAGCRQYSNNGAYASSSDVITWAASQSNYFNKNLLACNSKDEACTELLRVKPTWGANLIMDTDFNNEEVGDSSTGTSRLNDWAYWGSPNIINGSRTAEIVDASSDPIVDSGKALKLQGIKIVGPNGSAVVGTFSDTNYQLLPDNFQFIPGQTYTFSADVYLAVGSAVTIYIGPAGDITTQQTGTLNSWQHLTVTREAAGSFSQPIFGINASSNGNVKVYFKNLKFEVSEFPTAYNLYGAFKVYEKILPPYLEAACYNDITSATKDYRLRAGAPIACDKFARKCNRDEVGCELYTNKKTGLAVSAQVTSGDYCPEMCLGYDQYISRQDYFNSPQAENLMPSTAKSCGAAAVGCSEFTNLDALNQGGETKEYYSALKQCIKPDTTQCASFYSWEGTDAGYQLRASSLKKDNLGAPAVTANDSTQCNATIYNKTIGDPEYNSDCREFYNAAGQISYHLISRTITCSDNCHAYRRSDKNIDKTLTQAQCNANPTNPISRFWSASAGCYVCQNGGAWDTQLNTCVYQAIPGEGSSCSAAENGCREYNGNDGNNVRMLFMNNFEGDSQSWTSNCTAGIQYSSISNNKNGHSLLYKDAASNCVAPGREGQNSVAALPIIKQVFASAGVTAQVKVAAFVSEGKSYSLRFIAKAALDTSAQIYFTDNNTVSPKKAQFATNNLLIKGGGEWKVYQTNLENLDHAITAEEVLAISANHDFYFDDVILTEITDRYYLIKESSQIPDDCYGDDNGKYQGPDYNLGCTQYIDRDNLAHNLRKFSKLCSDSAVGCEQMLATQNYKFYTANIWNDTNKNGVCDSADQDCVSVPRDKAIYAIYDAKKQCNGADMGCSRLGQGSAGSTSWVDVYKKNDPNSYDTILCSQTELGCEEWKTSDGTLNYFRDPGDETCQYRASQDLAVVGKAWYKVPVKRCDLNVNAKIDWTEINTKVCSSVNDCTGKPCIIDTNDYLCTSSYFKTLGIGGAGNQVAIPAQQAGLCEPSAAGCTEFIDPVSKFASNLVYNPSYEMSSTTADGWGPAPKVDWKGAQLHSDEQVVIIEANKLYIFSARENVSTAPTTLSFMTGIKLLQIDNNLGTSTIFTLTIPSKTNQNIIFASLNNSRVLISGGAKGKIIELKPAIINYQLQENIDRKSCNGITNIDKGCILFNERSINDTNGLRDLSGKYDAQESTIKGATTNCITANPGSCTANEVIKVSPNRTCSKWLDCSSYTQDPITQERNCFTVGECTRLDDKNECANFEDVASTSIKFSSTGQNKNATGYYLLNKYHLSNMTEVGINTEAHFDFEDNVPALSCKQVADGQDCQYTKNIINDLLVREPEKTPPGVSYPAHGASFLRVPSAYLVSPQPKNNWTTIIPGKTYYVNLLVNTQNTGLSAKVNIMIPGPQPKSEVISTSTLLSSNNGWSRQVFSFVAATSSIRITLETSDMKSDREVYFDDINIEPVLEINNDKGIKEYVSRECRLYPTNDSLTCVNKNNNVLKDGWEGYCLQHDQNNPAVCQLWYPVDSISSAKTNRNASGYLGKFPLNYCTEVNGNFDLVEKRVNVKIFDGNTGDCGAIICDNCGSDGNWCYFPAGTPQAIADAYATDMGCVGNASITGSAGGGGFDCQSNDYVLMVRRTKECKGKNTWNKCAVCVPLNIDTGVGYRSRLVSSQALDLQCDAVGQTFNSNKKEGWYVYNGLDTGPVKEAKSDTNPVRVYNYDRPAADEDGLKLISGSDPDKNFRLTCNKFIQTVDYNGDNKAWAARTGINSIWATTTPPYFIDTTDTGLQFFGIATGSVHFLSAYGRNRQDTPFGSALWPDAYSLLSSDAIKLRDQFSSKNREEVLAGRPYGCSNNNTYSLSGGCANIGYCSFEPSVYCLVGNNTSTDFVSRSTCSSGGFGSCVPLWKNSTSSQTYLGVKDRPYTKDVDFITILKNLFLKSYNAFSFSGGSYAADANGYDFLSNMGACTTIPRVESYASVASSSASFCYIIPSIPANQIRVTFDNKVIASSTTLTIPKKGIYGLQFNSIIDPEQQPLKEIIIAWGDGNDQLITGQDSHPSVSNPHIFYHYYKTIGQKTIKITITDNWGKWATR